MAEYLYKSYEDPWNPIDAVVWVDSDGSQKLAESPDVLLEELDEEIARYELLNTWDSYTVVLHKLKNGDYLLTTSDCDMTFSTDRAYRAADLETIVRWCMTDEERLNLGPYEITT